MDFDFDADELDDAEFDDSARYEGEIPPEGTILRGYVSKMWATETQGGDHMLKVLWVADENEGDLEEYNGLAVWENLVMTTAAKFKWAPFFSLFDIKVSDVKNKTKIENEDDNVGAPIISIGSWEVGSDEAWCRIVIHRRRWQGNWQAEAQKFLPYEEPEAEEEPEEEEAPPARPATRSSKRSGTKSATPARSSASKRRAPEPEPEEEDAEEDTEPEEEPEEEPTPARSRSARPAQRSARPAPAKAAPARGRRAKVDDDPPF